MADKEFKHKADKLMELVSQGIPSRPRKIAEMDDEKTSPQENDKPEEQVQTKTVQNKRRTANKGDYKSTFFVRNDLNERKTIYIAKELQDKLINIVHPMRSRDLTIGVYVENILLHHFETYKDEINQAIEEQFIKPL